MVIAPVAATIAGALVIVDGTGTTDPEGDALTFSWSFGDGGRANGSRAAHVYGSSGTFTLTLTVRDATGAQASASLMVTVSANPAGTPVPVAVKVKDLTGALQPGATVSLVGTSTSAMTNASGVATLQVPRGAAQTLRIAKTGFVSKVSVVTLTTTQTAGHLDVVLPARRPATQVDATTGGLVTGFDEASLDLPAGAVVDSNGVAVSGLIDVALTPVDVRRNADALPGAGVGISPSGTRGPIATYGATEFSLTRNGVPLNLAPGRTATIELPMNAELHLRTGAVTVGTRIPLWSLDETTGLWVHEGDGEVIASSSATGLSLRATVGHFSWWGVDAFSQPNANPQPQCCIDDDADGSCDTNGTPEYCWLRGTTSCPNGPGCPPGAVVPTTMAETFIPGVGGVTLPVPANVPVSLIADAPNGTHHGVLLYTGLPNANDVPVVVMTPTGIDGGAVDVTLPSVQTGVLTTPADQHVYRFIGQANDFLSVRAFRANGLPLEGTVRVDGPNGYTHDQVAFGYGGTVGRGGTINLRLPFSGPWLVSVKGTLGLPNRYSLALSTTPAGLYLTSTSPAFRAVDVPLDAGVWAQFSGSLAGTPTSTNTSGLFIGAVTEVGQTRSLASQQLVITRPAPLFADTNYSLVIIGSQSTVGTGIIVGTGVDGGQADWAGRVTIPFRTARVPGEPSVVERDVSARRAAAMFDDGRRLLAWGDNELKVASYSPDAGWSAPQVLSGGSNGMPCLAPRGSRALLASVQNGSVSTSWWSGSRFSPVTSLGAGIGTAEVGCALSSTQGLIAFQSNGFPLSTQTWVVASTPDGGWEAPLLATDGGTMQGKIHAAANASGAGLVAWARLGANGRVIDTARLTASGWVVQPETVVVTNQPQSLGVGVDDLGTMVVTWFDGVTLLHRAVVREAGVWSAPTTLFTGDSYPIACTNSDVQVVPTTGGGFTVFACVGTMAGAQVLSRTFSGGSWGAVEVVHAAAGGGALLVKGDHSGFAWLPTDTAGRVLRSNGTWGPLFTQPGPALNGTLPVVSPAGKTGFVYDLDSHEAFLEGP